MSDGKKTCFVVMGFGEKTDYSSGRVLNLDATYKHVIKPAVEAAGLECIRADEIVHAGVIDVPMYKQLLTADIVVADLSTSNPNAFYELGVRHALRPFTTIVISESQLKYPFDVNHTVIRQYEHLGKDVGFGEAQRFIGVLKDTIEKVLLQQEKDSPVYTYLNDLDPPSAARHAETVAAMAVAALTATAGQPDMPAAAPAVGDRSVSTLMEQAAALMNASKCAGARDLLKAVLVLRPGDPYVVQKLALATYKAKEPDPLSALHAAKEVLRQLAPHATSDPETLGLWGAIHKRLWELEGERAHLDESIMSYEKGFSLKNDYYNGINVAFMLNVRASISPPAEAIADWVTAERIRHRVIAVCEASGSATHLSTDARFWMDATLAEAWLGVGNGPKHEEALKRALGADVADWMRESAREQSAGLTALLQRSPLRFLDAQAQRD
jgi:hypothetical protein